MIVDIQAKLKRGYDKLISFKTKEKGYEWFGGSPAHEGLSAYGLMQFTEMSQVTSFVDDKMVSDLKDFLLSRKDGKGLFLTNEKALDSFGRAPDNITAAYIVWTLTESGETNLTTEIDNLIALADKQIKAGAVDAYFCGLLSCSLYNLNRNDEARVYADALIKNQLAAGNVTQSLTSITSSMGENLVIESSAISVLAWMHEQSRYGARITPAINWIVSKVTSSGLYGTTQATILSLKAITLYMKEFTQINGQGQFVLYLNGRSVQSISFDSENKEAIAFDFDAIKQNNTDLFAKNRTVQARLALEQFVANAGETKDFRINYAFSFNYYDQSPQSSANPVLQFNITSSFD